MKAKGERSLLGKLAGRLFLAVATIEFVLIGIPINVIQFLLRLCMLAFPSGSTGRRFLKELNGSLIYMAFAAPLTVIYYWSQAKIDIYLSDSKTRRLLEDLNESDSKEQSGDRKQLTLIVMNHSYDLDYMICFIMMDQLGQLKHLKLVAKKEISYMPLVGTSMAMSDIVFVRRGGNWDRDRLSIGPQLDQLLDYKRVCLSIYPEGTRFSEEKYQASVEFAKSRNLKPLCHHLWPKTKGFAYTLSRLIKKTHERNIDLKLINVQCIMSQSYNIFDFLDGRPLKAQMFCENVPISDDLKRKCLEFKDEDEDKSSSFHDDSMKQLLIDMFRRKDEIVDLYRQDGGRRLICDEFKEKLPIRPPTQSNILFALGTLITFSYTGHLLYLIPWTPLSLSLSISFILISSLLLYCLILRESIVNHKQQQPHRK